MSDVITLPTAAAGPVFNKRRAGSYGRKLVSFNSARDRRETAIERAQQEARRAEDREGALAQRRVEAALYFGMAVREAPLTVAGHIEMLTTAEQIKLLTHRAIELQSLALELQRKLGA